MLIVNWTGRIINRYVHLRSVKDGGHRTGVGYGSTRGTGSIGDFDIVPVYLFQNLFDLKTMSPP